MTLKDANVKLGNEPVKDEEEDGIVWDEEVEKLSEGNNTDYFKPEKGKNEITFLDEGTVYEDEKKFDDEPRDYVKFKIEVGGETKVWDMSKSRTKSSKFGMIAQYAAKNGGLEGETVTWFTQGEGQNTKHMLMDLED